MMMRRLINSGLKNNSYNLINKQHYVVNNSEWELYNKYVFNSYSNLPSQNTNTYSNNQYQTMPITNYNITDVLSDTINRQKNEIKFIKMELDTLYSKINTINKQLENLNEKYSDKYNDKCIDICKKNMVDL